MESEHDLLEIDPEIKYYWIKRNLQTRECEKHEKRNRYVAYM